MRKMLLVTLLSSVLVAGLLAGCGSSSSSGGSSSGSSSSGGTTTVSYDDGFGDNVLRITYQAEPESADPAATTADYILMMNCMDTLVATETNEDGENVTVPSLATEWEISEDGLTYTFTLRDDVTFHNGEPFTADDVLYTVDRMLDPNRAAVNTSWMDMIAGAQDVLDGKAETVEGVGINVIDDTHVEIILASTYSPFLSMLSVPAWSIVNREAGEAADEAGGGAATSVFGSDPEYYCGTGPFILKEWVLNDHVYLETNPDYWQGASEMDGILIKIVSDAQTEKMMFDSGQIDIFDLDHAMDQIPYYMESEEWSDNIVEKTVLGTSYLSINESIEPFDDVRVREAISLAIDRQTIVDSLYNGAAVVATTFLPEGVPGYPGEDEDVTYDPEKAKQLLEEAGYGDGFDMVISQQTNSPDDLSINEVIADQLSQVGINVTIDQVDSATWYDTRRQGTLPSYRTSWTADFNDPDNFLYQMFGGDNNVTRSWNYTDSETLQRLSDARYIVDEDERTAEYEYLETKMIGEDVAMVPLWHKVKIRVLQDRVQGFVPMWAGYGDCCYYGVSLS